MSKELLTVDDELIYYDEDTGEVFNVIVDKRAVVTPKILAAIFRHVKEKAARKDAI